MLPFKRICCDNCEHLRVDNYCLVKGKYILTKHTSKTRDCIHFTCKHQTKEVEKNEKPVLLFHQEESWVELPLNQPNVKVI